MTDEKYVFVTDVRDKKRIGRGAFNKRTHAGKGGAIKFPSDFLNRKELNAMNGEVKSYRLNEPMVWKEFKAMPDEIKISYIKALRNKFDVPDNRIAKMMGINQCSMSQMMKKLGISGKRRSGIERWDVEGFTAFVHGIPEPKKDMDVDDASTTDSVETANRVADAPVCVCQEPKELEPASVVPLIPASGTMTFEGKASAALKAVEQILDGSFVRISVTWESCESE